MKIFLSYSTDDMQLVRAIAEHVRHHAELFYWDQNKLPGQDAWHSIFGWIEQADLVLVVITDKAMQRAMSIGSEIGHAKAKGKTIVPLVASDVSVAELGCLAGITYQAIDPKNPGPALQQLADVVVSHKQKLEKQEAMFLLLGIAAFIWLGSQK